MGRLRQREEPAAQAFITQSRRILEAPDEVHVKGGAFIASASTTANFKVAVNLATDLTSNVALAEGPQIRKETQGLSDQPDAELGPSSPVTARVG